MAATLRHKLAHNLHLKKNYKISFINQSCINSNKLKLVLTSVKNTLLQVMYHGGHGRSGDKQGNH